MERLGLNSSCQNNQVDTEWVLKHVRVTKVVLGGNTKKINSLINGCPVVDRTNYLLCLLILFIFYHLL